MNLQKTLFAGALLTVVVAALLAQEESPPEAAPAAEEQLESVPVEVLVADGTRTNTIIRLKERRASALKLLLDRAFENQLKRGDLVVESDENSNCLLISGNEGIANRAADVVGAIDRFQFTSIPNGKLSDLRQIVRSFSPETISVKDLLQSLEDVDSQKLVDLSLNGREIQFSGWEGHVHDLVDLAERLDERATIPKGTGSGDLTTDSSDALAQGQPLPEDGTGGLPADPDLSAAERAMLEYTKRDPEFTKRNPAFMKRYPAGRANGLASDTVLSVRTMEGGQPSVDLLGQFRAVDDESVQIARRYRELADRDPSSPQLETERQGLINAVTAAFDVRQRFQEMEVTRLQERLRNLERTIASRNQARNQIIERRVSELINPEQRWGNGPADPGRSHPGAPQSILLHSSAGQSSTSSGGDVANITAGRRRREAGFDGAASTSETLASNRAGSLSSSGSGVDIEARAVIEAASNLGKARTALAESESLVELQTTNLKRWQEANPNRPDSRSLSTRDKSLQRAQAQRQRAEEDLKAAIRQEQQARLSLETRIKLLQIDLESAKVNLDQALRQESRAQILHQKNAMSRPEFEEKQSAAHLARLAVQKAETLLSAAQQALKVADEYRQSDPGFNPQGDGVGSSSGPDPTVRDQRLNPAGSIDIPGPARAVERFGPAAETPTGGSTTPSPGGAPGTPSPH